MAQYCVGENDCEYNKKNMLFHSGRRILRHDLIKESDMLYQSLNSLDDAVVDTAMQSLVFLRSIKDHNHSQWLHLKPCCQLIDLDNDEHLIEPGNDDKTIYFLVKGELEVYPSVEYISSEPVGHIIPGQILGEIAVICNQPRQALVKVANNCKHAQVIGLDYSIFGELPDFSKVSLAIKLVFFRQMVNHTRWRIEMFRIRFNTHELARSPGRIEIFRGEKDSLEELVSLQKQMQQMATLLSQWNHAVKDIM
jgi:CRP/FNR family transcriptional regulator, cyclic AMP receptor protein